MKKLNYVKKGHLILGVNGWLEGSHDASAALVEVTENSCRIIAALEEEKVRGIKGLYDCFPTEAIKNILEMCELQPEDIDEVTFGWDYPTYYKQLNLEWPYKDDREIISQIFDKQDIKKEISVTFINHHLAHAASSYRTSQFNHALNFVIDGNGENESCTVWLGQNDTLEQLATYSVESSFGFLYEAVNLVQGFRNNESGKTMGLAAYGKPEFLDQIKGMYEEDSLEIGSKFKEKYNQVQRFNKTKGILAYQDDVIKTWLMILKDELNLSKNTKKPGSFYDIEEQYKNLAATVQKCLEDKMLNEVSKWVRKLGINKVCISGGVGLNCTENGKILGLQEVDEIFVNPAAGDAGVSLGSALERAHQLGYCSRIQEEFSPYLGVEVSNEEVMEYLQEHGIGYEQVEGAEAFIVDTLMQGKTLAVFQERNEWGPRALGARSIISLPTAGKLDFINQQVKERELGRPLGPSMLQVDSCKLKDHMKVYGKYMNIAYTAEYEDETFASILHCDKTYRPQFVDAGMNKAYASQLQTLKDKTGNSIVINTSFNHTTPIIYHIEQAIEFLAHKEISAVVFNNQIIVRKEDVKNEL